jgi:hypothetical protein
MRALVSYLNEKTPQDLRVIAELWEASLTDRLYTGNTFQLAQEMLSEFLQRRLLEKLDLPQLKLLAFLAVQPATYNFTLDELTQNFQGEEVTQSALRLRQMGLLYDDSIRLSEPASFSARMAQEQPEQGGWKSIYQQRNRPTPAGPRKAVLVLPRELAHSLKRLVNERLGSLGELPALKISHLPLPQLLERLEPELLESMAETWGLLGLQGTSDSAELAKELVASLTDKTLQGRVLDELPTDSQELFEQLKRHGGRTTILDLRKEFVSLKRLGRNLRPLTERLLVWEAFEDGQSVVFVPPEIAKPKQGSPEQLTLPLQTVTEPTSSTTFPPYALAWDTLTFLNFLGQNEVELTNQQYIPKRLLKKLLGLLWLPEEVEECHRFSLLLKLNQRLHLYQTDEETRRLVPGPGLDDWLRLNFYEQTRKFFDTWLSIPYLNSAVSYPYYYGGSGTVTQANKTILSWLTECKPGVWYSVESLLHKVQRTEPFFIRSRRELLNQFGLQRVEEIVRRWPHVEGQIIRNTLGTVLEWLGVVRVSRGEAERVESFALTELGAELVGAPEATHQIIPPVEKPLLVQPNFEIMLFTPQVETLWTLLKFATLKKLDQVSLFSIDKASVLRAMESGLTSTMLLEWLSRRNPQPLPQNLSVSVQDWSKGFRRVMVERATLLEVDDPAILDELLQSKQYAEFFVRRLSPTAAVIKLPETKNSNYDRDSRHDPIKTFRTKLKNGGFFAT